MDRWGALVVAACALALALRADAAPPADGPVLAATRPASFQIDFGTIVRGQFAAREVSIHNPGTAPLEVTLGAAGAPFTAPARVSVGPGDMKTIATARVDRLAGEDAGCACTAQIAPR